MLTPVCPCIHLYPSKKWVIHLFPMHYCDVIMGAMASQITSLTIVYSTVHSGADQRKRQSSASLAIVRGIHRWPVNSPHKWPVTRKMFPFDDVIMDVRIFQVQQSSTDLPLIWPFRSVEIITVTSQWARWHLKSPASRLFTQPFVLALIKENIKVPCHWPLCGQFTDDRWIPRKKGQQRGKCFHLMTSSCGNLLKFQIVTYLECCLRCHLTVAKPSEIPLKSKS